MIGKLKLSLENLNCAHCAGKIEQAINDLNEVKDATLNFSFKLIIINYYKDKISEKELIDKVSKLADDIESGVKVVKYGEKNKDLSKNNGKLKLNLEGLDCAHCAGKIEEKVRGLENVKESNLNFSMKLLNVKFNEEKVSAIDMIEKIKEVVKGIEEGVIVTEVRKANNLRGNNASKSSCNDSCNLEDDKENKFIKIIKENYCLFAGIFFFIMASLLDENLLLYLISYILVGGNVLKTAFSNIKKGKIFDENFLMTVATIGAFAIGEYPEGVAVMIFYEIGEMFQSYAVNKSRKSISDLMDIKAEYANLLDTSGKLTEVSPEEVRINEIIVIKPGEKVPLDGEIIEGDTTIDSSALTGESLPVSKSKGDELLAGYINLNSTIKLKVTKEFEDSTVSRILELVQNSSSKKAKTEKFITKFSKYYTPIVVISAVVLAFIPPLLIKGESFADWINRALIFLVVSCPCALVVSVPLGLFAGIGSASKNGILIKGGNYLEALKDVDTVVFDKTGTLTKGIFRVTKINAYNSTKSDILRYAAIGEQYSNHPIAKSISDEFKISSKEEISKLKIDNHEEIGGKGVSYKINNKEVFVGNYRLMEMENIEIEKTEEIGTVVHVAVDKKYLGNIIISDQIKEDSKSSIENLKEIGIKNIVMLTGDNKKVAENVSEELGITKVYSELLPNDKVTKVEELLEREKSGTLAFVGDGINDAPVLARADVGIAMGGIGSDAAIEAADVVLMKDAISALPQAIKIARKTNRILWQNIIFSLGIKLAVLLLATIGYANMWEAVFADVGVTLIAVLNSMRALK